MKPHRITPLFLVFAVFLSFLCPAFSAAQESPAPADSQATTSADTRAQNDAAARKKFMQAEALYRDFQKIHLNMKRLESSKNRDLFLQRYLTDKSAAMEKAMAVYAEIIKGKSAKWGIPALIRLAEMSHDMGDDWARMKLFPPRELPEEVLNAYIAGVTDFQIQFYDKALEYYKAASERAKEYPIFDAYPGELDEFKRILDVRYPELLKIRNQESEK